MRAWDDVTGLFYAHYWHRQHPGTAWNHAHVRHLAFIQHDAQKRKQTKHQPCPFLGSSLCNNSLFADVSGGGISLKTLTTRLLSSQRLLGTRFSYLEVYSGLAITLNLSAGHWQHHLLHHPRSTTMTLPMQHQRPTLPTGTLDSPRPALYIVRNNGTRVPLIPADELPFSVRLQGCPRVLTLEEADSLIRVASLPWTGATYKLLEDVQGPRPSSAAEPTHTRNFSGSDTIRFHPPQDVRSRHPLELTSPSAPRPVYDHNAQSWRNDTPITNQPVNVLGAITNTQSGAESAERLGYLDRARLLPPSGQHPNPTKKIWCTHWMTHDGHCDYIEQGCMYKHDFPDTLKELKAICGLTSYPDWWVKQNQVVKLDGVAGAGKRRTAGPVVKASEWTKGAKASVLEDVREESEEETEGEGGISTAANAPVMTPPSSRSSLASSTLVTPTTTDAEDNDILPGRLAATHVNMRVMQTPQAPPPQLTAIMPLPAITQQPKDARQQHGQSTLGDLISFEPLVPSWPAAQISETHTLATQTPAKMPCPSSGISISHLPEYQIPSIQKTTLIAPPPSPTDVPPTPITERPSIFVPSKENQAYHLTDAKRHEYSAKRSLNARTTQAPPLNQQIVDRQRNNATPGLSASMHAPKPDEVIEGRASVQNVAATAGRGRGRGRGSLGRTRLPRQEGGASFDAIVSHGGAGRGGAGRGRGGRGNAAAPADPRRH